MGQGWDEAEAWPVARSYTGAELNRISSCRWAGSGPGDRGVRGRGRVPGLELENHPSRKGLTSALTFFACRVAGCRTGDPPAGPDLRGRPVRRGGRGRQGLCARWPGCPGSGSVSSRPATRSGGWVCCPTRTSRSRSAVSAFSPLVPGDHEASGLPLAFFRITLTNRACEPKSKADVMFSAETLPGHTLRAAGGVPPSWPDAARPDRARAGRALLSDQAMDPPGTRSGARLRPPPSARGHLDRPGLGCMGKWNQGLFAMWEGFLATGPARARGRSGSGSHGPTVEPPRWPGRSGPTGRPAAGGPGRGDVPARVALPQPAGPGVGAGRRARAAWPGRRSSATTTPP